MQKTKSSRKFSIPVPVWSLVLFIAFLCLFSARWFVTTYGRIGFDSILFTLSASLDGVQSELITSYLSRAFLPTLIGTLLVSVILFYIPRRKYYVNLSKDRRFRIYPLPRWLSGLTAGVLSLSMIVFAAFDVELTNHIWGMINSGHLFEYQYVDPDEVELTFPEEKRNLVYIMLESMEISYLSEELGGGQESNLIPELYDLALKNTNFSHNDSVGGFHQTSGASWTIGAMVAQTAGIPLKTPEGLDDWQNGYGKDGVFLPGATSLTNILDEAGYHTSLMVGSDVNFGGRKTYYATHGTDAIYDVYTARKDGIIPSNYFVWWGMEDLHLFEYAKQELTEIAAGEDPFAFTMLTVDPHHIGGYQCEYCTDEYEETYEQSISCSSRQVLEFVQWIQAQPWYEDTTIVITGDHCSMDKGYFSRNVDEDYQRMVYNCIINPAEESDNTKNRQYCAMDLFPTTLSALGVEIEGDRLGLGTDLFSDTPTLSEEMGFERFNSEVAKSSDFYKETFYTAKDPS